MMSRKLFDEISRILASPMPRRRALRLMLGSIGGAAFATFWPSRLRAGQPALLNVPIDDFVADNSGVAEVARRLRQTYGLAISFIEAADDGPMTFYVQAGTVQDVLNRIIQQNPVYAWTIVRGRIVVLPNDPRFSAVVSHINIRDVPRITAAQLYIDALKLQNPSFDQLAGTLLKGNRSADLFSAPVSLTSEAAVLDHLVQLLGDDSAAAFSIQRGLTGKYVFWLSTVSRNWPADTATCRGLSFTYDNVHDAGCGLVRCGVRVVYDITAINTCTDDNCEGQNQTEMVTTDNGCGPGDVAVGPGCSIGPGNSITDCTDTYELCGPPETLPDACTEIYTQQLFVGGTLVETCQMTFTIIKSGDACDGSFTRSCTPVHQQTQCCRGDFCPPDFPNCCPDGFSAACCSSDFPNCCPAGSAFDCCSAAFPVCCPGDSGSGCCTADFPVCCSGFCCPSNLPVCGDPGSFQCFGIGAPTNRPVLGVPAATGARGGPASR